MTYGPYRRIRHPLYTAHMDILCQRPARPGTLSWSDAASPHRASRLRSSIRKRACDPPAARHAESTLAQAVALLEEAVRQQQASTSGGGQTATTP